MNSSAHRNKKGFTLVELLIVISIISILAVIGGVVFSKVIPSARDARRKADLDQLMKAYAQYAIVNGGIRLSNACGVGRSGELHGVCVNNNDSPNDWYIGDFLVSRGYLTSSPKDPSRQPNYCTFYYYTDVLGKFAQFSVLLENPTQQDLDTLVGGPINWSDCVNGNYRLIFPSP